MTLFGFILGIFKSFTTKPVFQGEFQIVIEQNNSQNVSEMEALKLLNQFQAVKNTNQLKTQVKILESPSVLMPIFKFVKDYKLDSEEPRKVKYKDWTNNLKVVLEPGTSVLNISYKDTNKILIKKVLDKISSAYQEYSGREEKKSIERTSSYLEDQIKIFKAKSSLSMEIFQKFSIQNGLGAQDGLVTDANNVLINNNSLAAVDIYDGNTKNRYQNHFYKLSILEAELVEKEALLTPNSMVISNLKKRIDALKKSLDKPIEIINKYRELKLKAIRDEMTLIQLEQQLNLINLQKSKKVSPWQLISTPTLLDKPVEPEKKKLTLLYTFFAFLIASILAILVEKKSKIIFNLDDLKNIIPYPLLKVFQSLEEKEINYGLKILFNSFINKKNQKIAILSLNKIDILTQEKLLESFKNFYPNQELLITENLNEILSFDTKILLVNAGSVKSDKLEILINDLVNNCNDIKGWIYFS